MKQVVASLEGPIDIAEQELLPEALAQQADSEELRLLERLRGGDEVAFASLVDRHHGALVRLARAYVSDHSIAEEVVQETWIGVLEGLDRFKGRSSLKTWIFSILTNKAKTRGVRESRHVSFSPLEASDDSPEEPAVDPTRFRTTGHWAGYWASYPQPWDENTPEKLLLSKEGTAFLEQAIEALPAKLRQIIVMRDVEGLSSEEACNILGISETNQRVLLHRARSRVRRGLEKYLEGGARPA
jgi:RNA polymerase sigma-70 factor, ECF subfamily